MTGIYRATPMRVNPRQRNVKAVYKTYIDVIHFKKTDKKRLYSKDPDGLELKLSKLKKVWILMQKLCYMKFLSFK